MTDGSLVPLIESLYENFTPVERLIADFFIKDRCQGEDFSAERVANSLHVSNASLTRFSKKCGYAGYREFIFDYKESTHHKNTLSQELTKRVLDDYSELLYKTYQLVDEEQMNRIIQLFVKAKRVYIYGKGSSGLVAEEMKFRFMRLGLICEAITDSDMMRMNNALLDEDTLLIGISVSGKTKAVIQSLEMAHLKKASTLLLTANNDLSFMDFCDEILLIAVKSTLSQGNIISPQFPILIMTDIFYAYFLDQNRSEKERIFTSTLKALEK